MKKNKALSLLLLPGLLGAGCFFLLPCLLALHSSLTKRGAGGYSLAAYLDTLTNPMFRLGMKNFLTLAAIAIPVTVGAALGLALLLRRAGRGFGPLFFSLLLPFVTPSGSTAFFWNSVFGLNGLVNRLLFQSGFDIILWEDSRWSLLVPAVIYLWRNCGLLALLLWAGLRSIPEEYHEIARLEGAGRFLLFRRVTLVYLAPALTVVLLLAFLLLFPVSRELGMLFGSYPGRRLYLLQHFLGSRLGSMDLSLLSAAAVMVVLCLALLLLPLWTAGKKLSDTFVKQGEDGPRRETGRQGPGERVLLFLLAAVFLLPVLFTLANSFMSPAEVTARYSPNVLPENTGGLARGGLHFAELSLLPARVTLEQYARFLRNPAYLGMLRNGVLLTLPVLPFRLAVSAAAAYALFRQKGRPSRLLLTGALLLTLLPLQVMLTPQYILFRGLGLIGSPWAVTLPAVFHPLGICLLRLQLQGFPEDCIDAARLDGAGELSILTRLVLPALRRAVLLLGVYTFAECWNQVEPAVVLLDSARLPLSVSLAGMLRGDMGLLFAGSVVYLIPAALVFAIALPGLRKE